MKIVIALLLSVLFLGNQLTFAHSDHGSDLITETQAIEISAEVATGLSARDAGLGFGKLPASWASIPKEKITIYMKGNGYYIVAVENIGKKKLLYILMSSSGEVYDANFSGTFKGIE